MSTLIPEDYPGRTDTFSLPPELTRPFWVIAVDWDSTVGAAQQEDIRPLQADLETLLRLGVCIAVMTSANFLAIDRQLSGAIHGAHTRHLYILTDRGSEVYGFDRQSRPTLLRRRSSATDEENRLLTGVAEARITSDMKPVAEGLTGNSDAIAWVVHELVQRRHLPHDCILIVGGGFGSPGWIAGRDQQMLAPHSRGAVGVSVAPEPAGVPEGVIHLGGGRSRFQALLRAQIAAHRRLGQLPNAASPEAIPLDLPASPTDDPAWLLVEEGFTRPREHEIESLFAVANGYLGTRGALDEGSTLSAPATVLAGVFGLLPPQGGVPEFVHVPDWTRLRLAMNGDHLAAEGPGTLDHRRVLDLYQGILWREWRYRDPAGRITRLRFLRLASLADRHILVQSVALAAENYSSRVRLESGFQHTTGTSKPSQPALAADTRLSDVDALQLEMRAPGRDTIVALAAISALHGDEGAPLAPQIVLAEGDSVHQFTFDPEIGQVWRLDRLVSVYTSREVAQPAEAALAYLGQFLPEGGAPVVMEAHRQAWAERWQASDVQVEGDPEAQRALRFALYHLISAANPEDERVSIGARGLTGKAYKGHVFWDTEIFLLPFYIYTHPPTARALLMYRFHTLPAARDKARALGYRGALYAWESADDGRETTPTSALTPDGELVRILTGEQEHHISADIAYAVWHYWQVTGDDAFFLEAGAEILLETARFWASRVRRGPDGRYRILQVIGPDEYHEGVDDNAFTNVMAQWNLERGVEAVHLLQARWPQRAVEVLTRLQVESTEPEQWRVIAERLYTGLDPGTGLFEQFRGYFDLEPIDLAAYEPRTAPMDVLLGRQGTQRSQVIKQADVVMLLALLWERFPPAVREANFRYYEPRTAHGSSLSPAIYALVAARLGDVALAERYFRQGAAIDLANNMGNAAGGVHIAALGGLWQATVLGFARMTLRPDGLAFAPRLPNAWQRLRFPVRWRGRDLVVTLGREPRSLTVESSGPEPMTVAISGGPQVTVMPGHHYRTCWENGGWGPWQEVQ
jgi:trehalose/maltose hydrolase-like predicted phosphorylase